MITPAFIFTVFMLTLGPIKVTPAFFVMTQGQTPEAVRGLAIKGTIAATAISLIIFLAMTSMAASWRVSVDDLRIAQTSDFRKRFARFAGRARCGHGPPEGPASPKGDCRAPDGLPQRIGPLAAARRANGFLRLV